MAYLDGVKSASQNLLCLPHKANQRAHLNRECLQDFWEIHGLSAEKPANVLGGAINFQTYVQMELV